MQYSDEQQAFLASHVWAVLATGRQDGSPQQAMVGYIRDGEGRILISTPTTTAKLRNVVRRPRVSLTVPDGRAHLVIYGDAETIVDDPERAELTADIVAVVRGPERPDPSAIVGLLEEQRRGVLRITPTKVLLHQ